MPVITDFSRLQEGMSSEDALDIFLDYCNKQNTLFAPDHWFRPYSERLKDSLPRAVSSDHIEALTEALLERVTLDAVIFWLTEEKSLSWSGYKAKLAGAYEAARLEAIRAGFFPWKDVDACRARQSGELDIPPELTSYHALAERRPLESMRANSNPCPFCSAPFEDLSRVFFVSPAWTWQELCGRAGWLTICEKCNVQVQFFCDLMN